MVNVLDVVKWTAKIAFVLAVTSILIAVSGYLHDVFTPTWTDVTRTVTVGMSDYYLQWWSPWGWLKAAVPGVGDFVTFVAPWTLTIVVVSMIWSLVRRVLS